MRGGARGFTLIELLVVMAIIGLITVVALPTISSYFKISIHAAARELGSTVKEAYNATVMTGKVRRIVYNLKDHQYWVEVSQSDVLLDTKESREREERRKRFSRKSSDEGKPGFQQDSSVTRRKIKLPRGVMFEDIITQQSPDPITEGTVYTHMFANGLTERTIIHLKDNDNHHVTLVLSAIVGQTDVYERYVTSAELERK